MIRKSILAAALLLGAAAAASAQSACQYIAYGAVLTPAQWNSCFQAKADYLGYTPLNPLNVLAAAPITVTPASGVVTVGIANGTSVANPGTGTLEALFPIQTTTGASKTFATADLFFETRRSNSGSAMTDTFPASTAIGIMNGTRITVTNFDASASDTITAGAGTTINGGSTDVVGPGRAIQYAYDLANTTWRRTLNTGSALLSSNNLSDVGTKATAQINLLPTPTRAGDIMYWNGTAWVTVPGNNGAGTLYLQETNSGVPSFTAPSGSGTVNVGTTNNLAYYASSTNAVSSLATANNGVLVTNGSGVPSIGSTIPTAVQNNITNLGTIGSVGAPIGAAFGGKGVTSPATHTMPINQGASAETNTGTGTTGQCVTSNGASADPSFAGGCWTLINTLTASNSTSLSDTTSLTATYDQYEIVFENLVTGTINASCEIAVHTGGTFQTTGYIAQNFNVRNTTTTFNTPTTYIPCNETVNINTGGPGISGSVRVGAPSQTASPKMWNGMTSYNEGSTFPEISLVSGYWNGGNGAVDGFQVCFATTGTTCLTTTNGIVSGKIKIYGRL